VTDWNRQESQLQSSCSVAAALLRIKISILPGRAGSLLYCNSPQPFSNIFVFSDPYTEEPLDRREKQLSDSPCVPAFTEGAETSHISSSQRTEA
jgi:hypothetical protein